MSTPHPMGPYPTWLAASALVSKPYPHRLRQASGLQCTHCGRELRGIDSVPLPGHEPRRACTDCHQGTAS
ncbi:hypothetical protein I3F58_09930 [Streptomyces sp. MUM 203J]|uniref:hypothetical protein n=1 Tax=Streptomyces sp. MUM 203J TaxID=2791990 RepID=UPI001F03B5BF|nr:hypothetical protein [Streptomyces sp. MUM 203J]MCH0539876.1 hypothetical protein [Streptomyces sp. MUM 203J]